MSCYAICWQKDAKNVLKIFVKYKNVDEKKYFYLTIPNFALFQNSYLRFIYIEWNQIIVL